MSETIRWVCIKCQHSTQIQSTDKPFKFCPECGCRQQPDEKSPPSVADVDKVEDGSDDSEAGSPIDHDDVTDKHTLSNSNMSNNSKTDCKSVPDISAIDQHDNVEASLVEKSEHCSERKLQTKLLDLASECADLDESMAGVANDDSKTTHTEECEGVGEESVHVPALPEHQAATGELDTSAKESMVENVYHKPSSSGHLMHEVGSVHV